MSRFGPVSVSEDGTLMPVLQRERMLLNHMVEEQKKVNSLPETFYSGIKSISEDRYFVI